MQPASRPPSQLRPLIVDLDGTLLRTDLLMEGFFALIKQNPLHVFALPFWVIKGKAYVKKQIADRVELDVSSLPIHKPFLEFLKTERAQGRPLVMATASNKKTAMKVAEQLDLFDDVLASDMATHVAGPNKLRSIQERFGDRKFDYAGRARADLPIWKHASEAILVNPERGVRSAVEQEGQVAHVFEDDGQRLRQYLVAMRPHQWLKNLLVFFPLLTSHKFYEPVAVSQAFLAFLAFAPCASSVYILNDLIDLASDRRHPSKRFRPFAAGRVSLLHGAALIPALILLAFALALSLPTIFLVVLVIYYVTTVAYSLRLKRAALVDVLALAGLYTLRVIAGAAAISVTPSFWLLAFSMFLFLSLALVKRYTEILAIHTQGLEHRLGRGYRAVDLETLAYFGTASAFAAVLVLALYINSDSVTELYSQPEIIWLLCPLLLYVLARIWLLARRNELHDDPVIFFIRDRRSYWLAGISALLLWAAI